MLVSESFPTFLWNSTLCILGNLLYVATRIEGHGSTGSAERLYPLSKRCGRGSILTVCVASPLQKDMATFTSSVGMPLRPQLSIACTTLLQEHPDITPSVTSSGGNMRTSCPYCDLRPLLCAMCQPCALGYSK